MKFRNFLLVGLVATMFSMCDAGGESYRVGDVFTDTKTVFGYVDTFSLKMSTIRLDSFVTSGNQDLFIGYYKDEEIGNVYTETYVPIMFSAKKSISEYSIYDSMVICFKPNGEWMGDTVLNRRVNIYEVQEEIKPQVIANRQYMFNNQRLQRSDECLATVDIKPFPRQGLVSWARMSDSLGQTWFEKLRVMDEEMASNVDFQRYFRGICIVPEATDYTWGLNFLGLNTSTSYDPNELSGYAEYARQFEIRLYYREPGDMENDSYMTFVLNPNGYMYNHMVSDGTGTAFENLQIDGDRVFSSESGHKSYIQTGSGLALRLDFPTLSELRASSEYMNVVDARLVIRPKDGSVDDTYKLPSTLYVAVTDESNDLYVNLTDMMGNVVSSPIYYGNAQQHEDPFYSFSVLKFIRSWIKKPTMDYSSLIVLPSDMENATTFKRVVMDDNTYFGENVQLQVYYVTY